MFGRSTELVKGAILPLVKEVEGLGVPVGQASWLGRTVEERQERAFIGAGLRPGAVDDPEPRLVVADDIVLTAAAAAWMAEEGKKAGRTTTFKVVGELGSFLDEATLGRRGIMAAWLPAGEPCDLPSLAQAPVMHMDPDERSLDVPVPPSQFGGADILQVPLANRLVFPTGHWLQLLWANLLGMGPFLWRELAGKTVPGMVVRLGWAVLRSMSLNPYRVGAALGRRGRGCRVHPSAVVEGCWLGDGVEIGANAVVRGAILADACRVEDQALVEFSVLGKGAVVQRQGFVKFSLLEPKSSCAGAMQLGVLGTGAAVKHGAILMDMNLAKGLKVSANGSLRRAPLGLAGVAVGPGATIGSGVSVAPGRAIPKGVAISPPRSSLLSRIPPRVAPGAWAVADGTLEKV